jgi:transcriptional regulator GlxA family with amidase domain
MNKTLSIVLFDDFTALDAFGPAEVFAKAGFDIGYHSLEGDPSRSSIGTTIHCEPMGSIPPGGNLLVPGGLGTRTLVDSGDFLSRLDALARRAEFVLSVCTGAALLARTEWMGTRSATSNKLAWDWVVRQNPRVRWKRSARWTVDGTFYSSSGITAGIDMALGFVSDRFGIEEARSLARKLEHVWNEDRDSDPFA